MSIARQKIGCSSNRLSGLIVGPGSTPPYPVTGKGSTGYAAENLAGYPLYKL